MSPKLLSAMEEELSGERLMEARVDDAVVENLPIQLLRYIDKGPSSRQPLLQSKIN